MAMTQQGYPRQQYGGGDPDQPRIVRRFEQEQMQYDPSSPAEVERPFHEAWFNWLWPIMCWAIMLANLFAIGTMFWSTKYDALAHFQGSAIAVLSLAVLALVYRFVLNAPPAQIITPAVAATLLPAPADRPAAQP